jgi:hypothetical protein
MCKCFLSEPSTPTISGLIGSTDPTPTPILFIDSDIIHKFHSILGSHFIYSEKTNSFHSGSVILIPEYVKELNETMSLQGSCFMTTRDKYFELNLCDEAFGSWGSQGLEVAIKTWLSGGRVVCNKKTWYGHMFRTQGEEFGFPYPLSGRQVSRAKQMAKEIFFNNKWEKQIKPLSWLLNRFWPVPGWTDEEREAVNKAGLIFIDKFAPVPDWE